MSPPTIFFWGKKKSNRSNVLPQRTELSTNLKKFYNPRNLSNKKIGNFYISQIFISIIRVTEVFNINMIKCPNVTYTQM